MSYLVAIAATHKVSRDKTAHARAEAPVPILTSSTTEAKTWERLGGGGVFGGGRGWKGGGRGVEGGGGPLHQTDFFSIFPPCQRRRLKQGK